jgi:hypothetical protein
VEKSCLQVVEKERTQQIASETHKREPPDNFFNPRENPSSPAHNNPSHPQALTCVGFITRSSPDSATVALRNKQGTFESILFYYHNFMHSKCCFNS